MFQILKDPEASSEDLGRAYIEAEQIRQELEEAKGQAYEHLMDLQKDLLGPGGKPCRELKTVRGKFEDLAIRCDACTHGLEQLRSRIGERLEMEAKERLAAIGKELKELQGEKRQLYETFLDAAARVVVLKEELDWRELVYSSQTGACGEAVPKLKVETHVMSSDMIELFIGRVKKYREESSVQSFADSLKGRQSFLSDEETRLQDLLQGFDPDVEVQRFLDRFKPKQEEAGPLELEPERKRSSPVPESLTGDVLVDYTGGPVAVE